MHKFRGGRTNCRHSFLDARNSDRWVIVLDADAAAGQLLHLIRSGSAITRGDLVRQSGLGCSTVSQRVEQMLAEDLIRDMGAATTGGRPTTPLGFNPRAGAILVADLGATHARFAVTDLAGQALEERPVQANIADGPEIILGRVEDIFQELVETAAAAGLQLRAIGAGVSENIYRRSTALSTSGLQLLTSRLGDRAGITGAAAMAIEHMLTPERTKMTHVAS